MSALLIIFFIAGRTVTAPGTENKPNISVEVNTGKAIIAPHDIQYEEKLAPDWKQIWDKARVLARQKKFGKALVQYELLFARKQTIDEARWEYTSLAMHIGRFVLAEQQLEILLRNDPDSPKYKLAYGDVLLALGKYQRAYDFYQQLYERPVLDKQSVPIITGLVNVLELQKKYEDMLPLLGKLLVIQGDDPALLKKILFVLIHLQQHEKASEYLTKLQQISKEDVEVLRLQARLQKQLGEDDNSASSWQRIIALKPDDTEAHRQLELYYRKFGNMAMELKQVEFNLTLNPDDSSKLLSRAAELNLQMKRADRALNYYVRYLAIFPDDMDIAAKKLEVERIVATDLLILVENKNAQVLWEDLSKITVDRLGVFKAIADLLRYDGKNTLLVEVIKIINKEEPGNEIIIKELVLLLLKLNRTDEIMELVPDYEMYIPKPARSEVKN